MITVREVLHDMGLEVSKRDHWSIGAMVREAYRQQYDRLPQKQLLPKTSGEGSHCFAVYPPDFRPKIEEIISLFDAQLKAQLSLFEDDPV